jgi:GMP synthase (glutamine-hydrolysing)
VARSLHLGILEADPVDDDLAAAHGNYPTMFRTLLETAAADLAAEAAPEAVPPAPVTTSWPVWRGVLPPGPDACDGWLVTGSRKSVNDDEPWIRELEAFVRALHAARRPLVGVCFGHQLVARALGGAVERAAVGWGVGTHHYEVVARAPWMVPARDTLALRASHQDQVVRLPEAARLFLRSDFCPLAGFTVGTHLLTIQPHPEFAEPYARALLDRRRSILGEHCWTRAVASLEASTDGRAVGRWFLRFLGSAHDDRLRRRLPDREGSA